MNIEAVRARFPALTEARGSAVFLDNPAGTQVPERVLERMRAAMVGANANLGGLFAGSIAAEALIEEARAATADLFGGAADEVVFGQNMTTLTFAISRAIGRELVAGDEVLLTRMDHDANVAPWLMLAEEKGLVVRWLDFDPSAFEFDLSTLEGLVTDRLKVAAIGQASNLTGTINDVAAIAAMCKAAGALVFVDAVQYAPHAAMDVAALGADFVVVSAYKLYGPHLGALWGGREVLERLTAWKARPAPTAPPGKFETGTSSREAIAGLHGAIEHLEWLGEAFGGAPAAAPRRERLLAAWRAIGAHEAALTERLIDGLGGIAGVTIQGLSASQTLSRRVPTVSFTHARLDPETICRSLAADGFRLWHGHNYAIEPAARLGLLEKGGVVRVGLAQYNTADEVDRLVDGLGAVLERQGKAGRARSAPGGG